MPDYTSNRRVDALRCDLSHNSSVANSEQPRSMKTRNLLAISVIALAACLPAHAELQAVSKVQPEFPKEAVQAGVDRGHVKARMTLDASGEVSRVEILEAQPRRVFDKQVMKTLAMWRYAAGDANRAVEIDVEFQR
jgi:protein TonB